MAGRMTSAAMAGQPTSPRHLSQATQWAWLLHLRRGALQ